MASPSSPHVAILAFPFSSHAAVILSMARALAAEAPAASFSFLSTGASLATLRKEVACPANLRFVEIPDGMPEDVGAGMPVPRRMELFLAAAEAGGLAQGLEAARAEAGGARVSCVLADAFLWMAADAAAAAGARWVAIWTGASSCLVAHLNTDALRAAVGDQAASREDELLTSTPGLGSYRIRDLPDGVVSGNFNYVINLLLHRMALRLPRADAIALNTFPDLDPPDVTAALAAAIPQCLPVGPFHLLSTVGTDRAVPDPHGCLAWLDRRAPRTVAYVSFGTVTSPPPAELHELAAGLEASGAPFLWSLKEELWPHLPPGFLDRTRETAGLVVTWAPQVAVLQHEAVGAFVTHAGWSSVLEGVTNAVPMACRPFFGDQRTNARSASNVWRVGTVFDGQMTNGAVAEAVKLLVTQEEGRRMRERARVLQTKAASAFEPDGGRRKNFEKLVNIVCGV